LTHGSITRTIYRRYLSMQYHLTRGVQRYFMAAAAHEDLVEMKQLRHFLFAFANEEEQHYLLALNDLSACGEAPTEEPLDVTLWHAYFRSVVQEHPFIRLGAAVILESIADGEAKEAVEISLRAHFLGRDNTNFLRLHKHETLPHGEQMVKALLGSPLQRRHEDDLLTGARQATVMYLRMAHWALSGEDRQFSSPEPTQRRDKACISIAGS
jgi:thiaminase